MTNRKITFILGPTASGKSDLALAFAQSLRRLYHQKSIIINCDAMQLYRDLSIITARPTQDQTRQWPHELFGILPAAFPASAACWRDQALELIEKYRHTHRIIIVGGTGLYANSLLQGLSPIPNIAPEFRAHASDMLQQIGAESFHQYLSEIDPISAKTIRPSDTQRMIRAVEIFLATDQPISHFQSLPKIPAPAYLIFQNFVLSPPRAQLHHRINLRVTKMVENHALDEINAIRNDDPALPMMKAIGVKEFIRHLQGEIPLELAVQQVQAASRAYAKRQMTWFRHQLSDAIWLESSDLTENLTKMIALDALAKAV